MFALQESGHNHHRSNQSKINRSGMSAYQEGSMQYRIGVLRETLSWIKETGDSLDPIERLESKETCEIPKGVLPKLHEALVQKSDDLRTPTTCTRLHESLFPRPLRSDDLLASAILLRIAEWVSRVAYVYEMRDDMEVDERGYDYRYDALTLPPPEFASRKIARRAISAILRDKKFSEAWEKELSELFTQQQRAEWDMETGGWESWMDEEEAVE